MPRDPGIKLFVQIVRQILILITTLKLAKEVAATLAKLNERVIDKELGSVAPFNFRSHGALRHLKN